MDIYEIQTAIRTALRENNLSEETLGDYLGLTRQGVNYLLNSASRIDLMTYENIKKYFNKRGIGLNTPDEKKQKATTIVIETAALLNHGLEVFHKTLEGSLNGTTHRESEIKSLLEQLENMQKDFTDKISEIKAIVR